MSGAPTGSHDFSRPLAGLSVLVTRTREQAAALVEPLEALGAEVIAFPVIEVADPVDVAAAREAAELLASYDWLVLTSTNGVDRFFRYAAPSDLSSVRIAAVGSATARHLASYGITPDFVPEDFRAEGLIEGFKHLGVGEGTRVLIARAEEAREILPETLRRMGADVDVVVVYRLVPATPDPQALGRLERGEVDIATFASGGTARHFVDLLRRHGVDPDAVMSRLVVASVGPVTTEGIRNLGFGVDVEAPRSTMEALVSAIVEHYAGSSQ